MCHSLLIVCVQLVPGLEESEYKREREFYDERGLPCPKDMEAETEKEAEEEQDEEDNEETGEAGTSQEQDYHRFDEQVNLLLESSDPDKMQSLTRRFVRVSSLATITHLKKFLALQVLDSDDAEAYRDIDITCDGELIPKDHTLKFVYITRWRTKDPPLKYVCNLVYLMIIQLFSYRLCYGPKINIEEGTLKKGSAPEWKLQPKVNYDDDEGDD